MLVLRNGQTLEGKVTRVGDLYYLAVPEGVIRLKAGDVELCCRSIEEAYRQKQAAIQVGDAEEHLRLAQWCLKQGLYDGAAAELADARKADPTHPLIEVLQHRLQIAAEPPAAQPSPSAQRSLSPEELTRMVRGLPPGSVETFTQAIQPLLMNNCTLGGCHGPQAQRLRLLRTPASGLPTRRLTQQNLHEVLQCIDPEQPDASRLLTAPLRPHGTARTAIFNEMHLAQYKRLVDWAHLVTGVHTAEVPATVARPERPPVQAMPADFTSPEPLQPAAAQVPAGRKSRPAHAVRKPPTPGKPAPPQNGAKVQQPGGTDPLDPEIFHRRFFGPAAAAGDSK